MVYGIISAKDNQTSLAYFKSKKVSQLEPENLKGRGLIKVDGEVMEFQTAIATDRCDDMERIELLRNMCASMAEGATEATKKAYLVDVVLLTVNGKIAAYKVMALHDVIDLE